MNISILSVFPQLYEPFLQTSLIKRAQEQKLVTFSLTDFFSLVAPKERIDAPTFGHGAGMLIKPEVVQKGVEKAEAAHGTAYKIFFSPHGKKLDQSLLKQIAHEAREKNHLLLVPARYEGMDARVEEVYADQVISIGDFVLMGGDLPAMMLIESLLRLISGVVGKQDSVTHDSFSGPFVDYPEYTMPVVWKDKEVPEVLRSGNHAHIMQWRTSKAIERTLEAHWEWLSAHVLSDAQKKMVQAEIPPHYAVLMHDDVVVTDGETPRVGTTSVTSLDIHDIARSARTYGICNYFIVTPLLDQQKIVRKLLDFWQIGSGVTYNASRHDAVKYVELKESLAAVIEAVEAQEGKKPLLIATSARPSAASQGITFHDQGKIWSQKRPVIFLFGTGKGLSQDVLGRCDYILVPLEGLTTYNHLSVRSAVAIILDKWLGLNVKNT